MIGPKSRIFSFLFAHKKHPAFPSFWRSFSLIVEWLYSREEILKMHLEMQWVARNHGFTSHKMILCLLYSDRLFDLVFTLCDFKSKKRSRGFDYRVGPNNVFEFFRIEMLVCKCSLWVINKIEYKLLSSNRRALQKTWCKCSYVKIVYSCL